MKGGGHGGREDFKTTKLKGGEGVTFFFSPLRYVNAMFATLGEWDSFLNGCLFARIAPLFGEISSLPLIPFVPGLDKVNTPQEEKGRSIPRLSSTFGGDAEKISPKPELYFPHFAPFRKVGEI